jgi:hypothetical protein
MEEETGCSVSRTTIMDPRMSMPASFKYLPIVGRADSVPIPGYHKKIVPSHLILNVESSPIDSVPALAYSVRLSRRSAVAAFILCDSVPGQFPDLRRRPYTLEQPARHRSEGSSK